MQLPRGIYFESTPAFHEATGQQHAYLVYRDGKGGERVIRGGPDSLSPTFGNIAIQADIPLQNSKDAYEEGETPMARGATRIDIGDRDPRAVWDQMVKTAEKIGEAGINYDLFNIDVDRTDGERTTLTSEYRGQNSNSVIRAVLKNSKIDVRKIITEEEYFNKFHGIENDLSNPRGGFNPKRPLERKPSKRADGRLRNIPDDDTIAPKPFDVPSSDQTSPSVGRNENKNSSNLTPAAMKIERAALGGEETVEETLSKRPDQLTEPEINRLTHVKAAMLSNDPNRARAENAVTEAHRQAFASGSDNDQTFPTDISPALSPAGQPVTDGIKQVVGRFLGNADDSGMPGAVSGLQTSLNHVESEAIPLKVDGIFGDKTRDRLRATVAEKGPGPILDEFRGDDDFDVFDDDDDAVFA